MGASGAVDEPEVEALPDLTNIFAQSRKTGLLAPECAFMRHGVRQCYRACGDWVGPR
jgi:hypothetical protein